MSGRDERTSTSAFGSGRREGHDASLFYERFAPPALSDDETVNRPADLLERLGDGLLVEGSSTDLAELPDASVALVVTSPPYFVGKEYEAAVTGALDPGDRRPQTYLEFLGLLREVFAECRRVLEPGGRIAVNVANLGRKPYRSLSADVIAILQDDLGLLLRGEVIWEKASTSSGSCAWGSFARASNPVLRDMTERVVIASKGRFARAIKPARRKASGLPHRSTLSNDEFVEVTRDVWRIDAESATRIGHPAPFPVELPRRLIDLYTYVGDIVLDPFAGSGSTIVAAARTGRIGVGYDTDPAYVELARQRLHEELAGRPADDPVQRAEDHHEQAIDEGRKLDDIAARVLTDAGFDLGPSPLRGRNGYVEVAYEARDRQGGRWLVDVSGGFTTARPGLQRIDPVWRLLGRLHAAQALTDPADGPARILVVTSHLPKNHLPAGRALRAGGPGAPVFDAIEVYDPAGLDRLAHYAATGATEPQPGFWTEAEIDNDRNRIEIGPIRR